MDEESKNTTSTPNADSAHGTDPLQTTPTPSPTVQPASTPTDDTPTPTFTPVAPAPQTASPPPFSSPVAATPPPQKKKSMLWIVLLIIVVLAAIVGGYVYMMQTKKSSSTPTATTVKPVVKVGLLQPFSGDSVSSGNDRKRAVAFAQKTLNPQNVDIQVVYADDNNCDEATVTTAVNKLITQDHVAAIIGDDCSSTTLVAAKIAEANKVVLMSSSSTSPAISQAGDYIYRTVPSDSQQGQFAANLIYKKGLKKLAIIHEDGAYGEGLAGALDSSFKALGGTVVLDQEFTSGTLDVQPTLQKVKAANPDAVYVISSDFGTDTAMMLGIKADAIGSTAAIYGSEALKSDQFIKDAGAAAEGLTVTAVTDGTPEFQERFKAEYGEAATYFVAQTYDAYTAIATTIVNGARTGTEIKDALNTLQFNGATQTIKFDKNGDVPASYEVEVVKNGAFVEATD